MKTHKRLNGNVRRTDLHPCTSRRVKHPCRHDNRSARFSFDDDDVSAGALLTVIAPHRTSVECMPLVVNLYFLPDNGRNNPAIALGRKNHLFAGSDAGGEHWAVIASLIETCKMNGVDPQAYLRDVLARIVARHPMGRIDELLPFAYVPAAEKVAA
jgi:hypothetical protein